MIGLFDVGFDVDWLGFCRLIGFGLVGRLGGGF